METIYKENTAHSSTHNSLIKYSDRYDAYYDAKNDVWTEEACDDPNCMFCRERPAKPSDAGLHTI